MKMNWISASLLLGISFFCHPVFAQVINLTPQAFKQQMETKPGYLLDVRTDWEYAEGHLKQAQNSDVNSPVFEKLANILDSEKPCYVYCHSGGRSSEASALLVSKGMKKVYNLEGGISAWKKQGYPVVKK
jgi:rhodanese-related sulfurtransferase